MTKPFPFALKEIYERLFRLLTLPLCLPFCFALGALESDEPLN
jgi:hypothetical protein